MLSKHEKAMLWIIAYGCIIWLVIAFATVVITSGAEAADAPPDTPTFLDAIVSSIPILAAAAAAWLLSFVRERIAPILPDRFIPLVLPVVGAVVSSVAKWGGVDIGDFNPETADLTTWQTAIAGALSGLAMTGLHQIPKQLRKPS